MLKISDLLPSSFPARLSNEVILHPVSEIESMRWTTLSAKEPETINWIACMDEDSTYIDIGANVGPYTLSAYCRGVKNILSFEPFLPSFNALEKVLLANSISSIHLFRLGISSTERLVSLVGNSLDVGAAEFSYSEEFFSYKQTCLLCRFDPFMPLIRQGPIYIKIDVDGSELDVLNGLRKVLMLNCPISLLVESDVINLKSVTSFMTSLGFVRDKRFDDFYPHSDERRLSENGNTARNIFFANTLF